MSSRDALRRASEVGEPLELEQRAAFARAVAGQDVLRRRMVDAENLEGQSPVAASFDVPVHAAAEFVAAPERAGHERGAGEGLELAWGPRSSRSGAAPRDRRESGTAAGRRLGLKSSSQRKKYSPETLRPRYLTAASIVQSWTPVETSWIPGPSAPGRNRGVPSDSRRIVSSGFVNVFVFKPWFVSWETARLVPIRGLGD